MRKVLFLLAGFFTVSYSFSQIPDDVVRNAWFVPNGTARSNAIGGAVGALGGDITSAYVNPAGLGFYKTKEIVITPSFILNNNKSNFRGTSSNINNGGFQLGPTGVVLGGRIDRYNHSTAFSISVNQLASYNNKISYKGVNDYSSYSEQYLEQLVSDNAGENEAASNYPFGASLAYYTFLIDTTLDANGDLNGYRSLVPVGNGNSIQQQYDETDGGGLYEVSFGFASNNMDKLFLGGSINIPLSFFNQDITYTETDPTSDEHNDFAYSTLTTEHKLNGVGLNARFGIIYRPVASWRFGLAFHTPSYMAYTDKLNASMTTNTEDYAGIQTKSTGDFENTGSTSNYNEITPYKFIASAAYVFNEVENVKMQKGFISADIEYVNHRGSRFLQQTNDNGDTDPSLDNYYSSLNDVIKSYYKGNVNVRVGGEIKFSPLAVRLGAAYYGSPYADKALKANRILLAGGLGYRNYGMYIDLSIAEMLNKDVNFPYRLVDKANTFATLKNQRTNVILTVGFKL
jgi:hypothetical protein